MITITNINQIGMAGDYYISNGDLAPYKTSLVEILYMRLIDVRDLIREEKILFQPYN